MMIKVCGMKEPEQVRELEKMGVDFAGLIFYKGSKRFVDYNDEDLCSQLTAIGIRKIGVFVNEELENVTRICRDFQLHAVQLHGEEDVAFCGEIRKHAKLVKVFKVRENDDPDEMVKPFMEVADYFLFDNSGNEYGGTGKKFNWDILQTAIINKPFFLSGGIAPEDVEAIRNIRHPFLSGLDLNSRFEKEPGKKNMAMLAGFINEIKK